MQRLLLMLLLLLGSIACDEQTNLFKVKSHESLKSGLRSALPLLESLDEFASSASKSRRAQKIASLEHSEFGVKANVRAFNSLKESSVAEFTPLLLGLLRVPQRRLDDIRRAAFDESIRRNNSDWRLHLLAHSPDERNDAGVRLACLAVARSVEANNFDVLLLSASTGVAIDADLFVMETKRLEQLGRMGERLELTTRAEDGDAGLAEEDVESVMAKAEATCLRRLGAYFRIAFDT